MDGSVQTRRTGPPRPGIAERIWEAARSEFSRRGYHGARVQGIARGASCNVALMYRHWASKRALYLDILRAVWLGTAGEIARLVEGGAGPVAVVDAYLDGAPFFAQLAAAEPAILEPVRRAAAAMAVGRDGHPHEPILAVVTVGGLAALVASARDATRPFVPEPISPEIWRRHVFDLLVHGLGPRRSAGDGAVA